MWLIPILLKRTKKITVEQRILHQIVNLVLFMKKMLKYAEWPDFMCRYYMNTRLCRAGRAWKRLILGKKL